MILSYLVDYTLTLSQSADDGSVYVQSFLDLKRKANKNRQGCGYEGKQLNKKKHTENTADKPFNVLMPSSQNFLAAAGLKKKINERESV